MKTRQWPGGRAHLLWLLRIYPWEFSLFLLFWPKLDVSFCLCISRFVFAETHPSIFNLWHIETFGTSILTRVSDRWYDLHCRTRSIFNLLWICVVAVQNAIPTGISSSCFLFRELRLTGQGHELRRYWWCPHWTYWKGDLRRCLYYLHGVLYGIPHPNIHYRHECSYTTCHLHNNLGCCRASSLHSSIHSSHTEECLIHVHRL